MRAENEEDRAETVRLLLRGRHAGRRLFDPVFGRLENPENEKKDEKEKKKADPKFKGNGCNCSVGISSFSRANARETGGPSR